MPGQLVGQRGAVPSSGAAADAGPGAGRGAATVRSSLLSRAGMLLGTSLDTGRTLAAIAELLVPSFADQCVVDLLDESGALRRAVTVRGDRARSRRISTPGTADRRVVYSADHPCAMALRTGRPALAIKTAGDVPGTAAVGPVGSAAFPGGSGDRTVVAATVPTAPIAPTAPTTATAATAAGSDPVERAERPAEAPTVPAPGPGQSPTGPNAPAQPGPVLPMLADAAAVIAVPLLGPRGIKGVLAVAADEPGRQFDQQDVELVEEVAARAGFALENASLYESMRSLALALQHSLLPAHLPSIDGVEVRVGYNPGDESDVGGDLYDVMELSSGRIGLAIGDVQGRGAHAAAVMGQLRAALRAYAALDMEPAEVLTNLDNLVRGLNEALLVTCVYAVYDPFTRDCVLANAGHLPPLLAGAHGCHPMEVPPDVPLGVGGVAFTDHYFTVSPGDTIVLYTDGVVERRGQSVDEGVRGLCDALEAAGPGASPAVLCRETLRAGEGPSDDDQAVLAMRTAGDALPVWRLSLPADPASASAARSHARAMLKEWSLDAQTETVELLVSELVTNAVRHASGPAPAPRGPVFDFGALDAKPDDDEAGAVDLSALEYALLGESVTEGLMDNARLDGAMPMTSTANRRVEIVMRRGRSMLWVEVHDQDVRTPRVRIASANDEGGRGLFLVDQLSRRWGVRPTPVGKVVWFQLAMRSEV